MLPRPFDQPTYPVSAAAHSPQRSDRHADLDGRFDPSDQCVATKRSTPLDRKASPVQRLRYPILGNQPFGVFDPSHTVVRSNRIFRGRDVWPLWRTSACRPVLTRSERSCAKPLNHGRNTTYTWGSCGLTNHIGPALTKTNGPAAKLSRMS